MKTIIRNFALCALAVALTSSCNGKKCTISGTIQVPDGAQNVWVGIGENIRQLDTVAVKEGKFTYETTIDPTACLYIIGKFDGQTRADLQNINLIPDSPKVNVTLAKESKVEGSPLSSTFIEIITKLNGCETEEDFYSAVKEAYNQNSQNAIGVAMFSQLAYELNLDEFDEMIEKGCDKIKNNESFTQIRENKVNAAKTAPGSEFIDFSGKTPEGEKVKLSDFVGKGHYTLVDFWASWCGPCMRSMPGMVNLWNSYHKKGLDIVGVAVWDGDNSASRIKIKEKGMEWPQIFVGDDKTPTDNYGITGIPHVILFDPEGIIIQRGIPDEEQLAGKIGDLLK